MNFAETCNRIFWNTTQYYHRFDQIDAPLENPYSEGSIEYYLCLKNWIDVVQWHLEDIIRNPEIDPEEALAIKRRIDKSNQERTDLVEMIDDYFLQKYANVEVKADATINTESPAWAIDRLSILAVKILLEQRADLSMAITQLLDEIESGKKYMKVYKQMKMYNDPALNPVLYKK